MSDQSSASSSKTSRNNDVADGPPKKIQKIFECTSTSNIDVLRAETMWACNIVTSSSSFSSHNGDTDVCKAMFTDSEIASSMRLSMSNLN